jgi:hypothetical protein
MTYIKTEKTPNSRLWTINRRQFCTGLSASAFVAIILPFDYSISRVKPELNKFNTASTVKLSRVGKPLAGIL